MAARTGPTPFTYVSGVERSTKIGRVSFQFSNTCLPSLKADRLPAPQCAFVVMRYYRREVFRVESFVINCVFCLCLGRICCRSGLTGRNHWNRYVTRSSVHQDDERRLIA